jgi:hypothetical protein
MQSDPEWAWAVGGHLAKLLDESISAIAGLSKTGFARAFLSMEQKSVKENFKQDRLLRECLTFVTAFHDPLDKLQKLLKKMLSMHRANMKD